MLKATAVLFKIQGKVIFPCMIDTFLVIKVIISYDNFIDPMKKSGARFSFSDFLKQKGPVKLI